jgi:hypothetical protein
MKALFIFMFASAREKSHENTFFVVYVGKKENNLISVDEEDLTGLVVEGN